ncbi:MAG: beta-lactamase family protein, partial [Gemmatimonadaceae bacterium]|nr:beta-lactamase family protein [Gemmatimonadaceae bacterium]
IAAVMAERLTGKSYEQLMQEEVFGPLGMTHTGLGRLATSTAPDGLWEHNANPTTGVITPDATAIMPQEDFHSHGPAGAIRTTHVDMAKFITANLSESGKPKTVVSDTTLRQSHERPDTAESRYTRAGWERVSSTTGFSVRHNGDNCRSRAELRVFPTQNHGYAAMTNVANGCADGKHIGAEAVSATLAVLKDMHERWSTLF